MPCLYSFSYFFDLMKNFYFFWDTKKNFFFNEKSQFIYTRSQLICLNHTLIGKCDEIEDILLYRWCLKTNCWERNEKIEKKNNNKVVKYILWLEIWLFNFLCCSSISFQKDKRRSLVDTSHTNEMWNDNWAEMKWIFYFVF